MIDLPDTAGSEKHGAGGEGLHRFAARIQHVKTEHPVVPLGHGVPAAAQPRLGDQFDGEMMLESGDIFVGGDGVEQRFFDRLARHVLHVENSALGVPALFAEGNASVVELREGHPAQGQFLDGGRTVAQDLAHRAFVAEPVARIERVGHVHFDVVGLRGHRGDAALGVVGVGLRRILFRDDRDAPAGFGHLDRKT